MMKKLICIGLALTMLVCLAGCGGKAEPAVSEPSATSVNVQDGKATYPFGSEEAKGMNAADVIQQLESAGFKNVQEEYKPTVSESNDGIVYKFNRSFLKGGRIDANEEVRVYAYRYQEESELDKPVSEVPTATVLNAIAETIEDTFGSSFEYCDVTSSTDPAIITMNIAHSGMAESALTMQQLGDLSQWEYLKSEMTDYCDTISDTIESAGVYGVNVVVNLLNDLDHSRTLLTVMNGMVVLDSIS